MPKLISSLNGLLCTYLMRQNLHNETHLNNVLAIFQNDSGKIMDVRALQVIFNV